MFEDHLNPLCVLPVTHLEVHKNGIPPKVAFKCVKGAPFQATISQQVLWAGHIIKDPHFKTGFSFFMDN